MKTVSFYCIHMILDNLQTERIKFRCLEQTDKPALLAFFGDDLATQFLTIEADIELYTDHWIQRQLKRYKSGSGGLHAIELKASGELIGQCGLVRQFVDGVPKWEVGYHLFRPHWGCGYATEAAQACRDFCFENEMAETLISLVHPENEKSKTVAKNVGMAFWKETLFHGRLSEVYKIIRPSWESLHMA